MKLLTENNYPSNFIKKLFSTKTRQNNKKNYLFTSKVTYKKGLFEKLKHVNDKYNIRLAPSLDNKIEKFLPALKQDETEIEI